MSRIDLLAEFLRDDGDIETEVIRVLADDLAITPGQILSFVDDGVVHLEGRVEMRSQIPTIWRAVRAVPGVVGLDERLTWELDDTVMPVSPVPWVGF